jgi:hypothetical protein
MRSEIESSLQVLIGLPLLKVVRAADLEMFDFGNPRTVTNFSDKTVTIGEYALHVPCAWRIRDSARIIVASRDRYEPAEEIEDTENFDWDKPGANLCDRKMRQFLADAEEGSQIVTHVESDNVGSLRILLSTGVMIEVFPDDSADDEYSEYWRFFKRRSEADHMIVANGAIK